MKYIQSLQPHFLKKLDTYLVLNAPHIWRTRIHFVAFFALLACLGLFLIGFFYPLSMYEISRTPYKVEDVKRASFLFLLICSFFSVVLWWQQVVKFRILAAKWYHSFMECVLFFVGLSLLWQAVNAFQNGLDANIAFRVSRQVSEAEREKLYAHNFYLPGYIDYESSDQFRRSADYISPSDTISFDYIAEAERLTQYFHTRIHRKDVVLDSQFFIRKENVLKLLITNDNILTDRLDDDVLYDSRNRKVHYAYGRWQDSIHSKASKYIKPSFEFYEFWDSKKRKYVYEKVLKPFRSDETFVLDSVYQLFNAEDKWQVDSVKNAAINESVDGMRKIQFFPLISLLSELRRQDFKNVLDTCQNIFFNHHHLTYVDVLKEESQKFELYHKNKQIFACFTDNDLRLYKNYLSDIMLTMPVYNRISNRAMEVGLYYKRDSLAYNFLNQLSLRSRKLYEELMVFYMKHYFTKEIASERAGNFIWNKKTEKYGEVEKYMTKGFLDTVFYYTDSTIIAHEKKKVNFDKVLNILNTHYIYHIYREVEDWKNDKDSFLIITKGIWNKNKDEYDYKIISKLRRDSIPMDTVFKWKVENYTKYIPFSVEEELKDGFIESYKTYRDGQINEQDSVFLDNIYVRGGYIRDSSEHSRLFFHANAYYLLVADMVINKRKAFLQGWNPLYLSTNYKLALIVLSFLMFFTSLAQSNLFTAVFVAFFINFVNNTFFNFGQSFQEVDKNQQTTWIFGLLGVLALVTTANVFFRKHKMPIIYLLINIQLFALLGIFIWLFDSQTIEDQSHYAFLSLAFWGLIIWRFRSYVALPSKR